LDPGLLSVVTDTDECVSVPGGTAVQGNVEPDRA